MKSRGSNHRRELKRLGGSEVEVSGIPGVAVKCVEIMRNNGGAADLYALDFVGSVKWV